MREIRPTYIDYCKFFFYIRRWQLLKWIVIEIVPQGNQFSLRIALTESATEAFFNLTKDNIGKTINIEFEGVLISGADIEAPIKSGYILSIPANKDGAESLRRSILSGRSNAP